MKRGKLLLIFTLLTFFGFGQVKTEQLQNVNVSNTKAVFLGKTEPLKDLTGIESTDRDKKSKFKKLNTAVPLNFIGRRGSKAVRPDLEHNGPDPIRQSSISRGRAATTSITPLINMDGLISDFGSPHDPSGDVGLKYYMQAINATDIRIVDKSDGSTVLDFPANALWINIGESSAGDPIVLFDHEQERWIITEFTSPNGTANLLFAISTTSDPLGSYFVYSFSPPSFPDYPKWAIWKNNYMVTTNEGSSSFLHQYFFDRAALLAGESEITMQRVEITGNSNTEAGFFVSTPVSWIGETAPVDNNPIALKLNDSSWGEVENDAIELFTFDVDFVNGTTVTKTTIETTPFDGYPCDNTDPEDFSCLFQGGSSQGIDGIPETIMNLPHYRNFGTHESIVLSFITDVNDGNNLAGIRWVELRRTTGDWGLYQEGTFAPDDGLHRFMPSISMDKDGNIALAYNTTSSSEFVGIKFTGRYAEDDLGLMTVTEFDVADGSASVAGDRFGDYAQMSIDPVDKRTFWYTSEYAAVGGTRTRIVAFQLEKNTNDLAVASISNPTTATTLTATETVSVSVENRGSQSATGFDLVLTLDDVTIETYTHAGTLAEGETLNHDFATTIDLSTFGDYVVGVEVVLAGDEVDGNNAVIKEVSKLAENDASVELAGRSIVCDDNLQARIRITNQGGLVLEEAVVEVQLNGSLVETINWTSSDPLENGQSVIEVVDLTSLAVGSNTVTATLTSSNGVADEVADDNTAELTIDFDNVLEEIELQITTDNWPQETTWELRDSNGDVVGSGGPYIGLRNVTFRELICVSPNGCYDFVMNDVFGDGICCGEGNGSYSLSDSNGNVIFASDGQFGPSEETSFCVGTECNLAVTTDFVNASNSRLGSIVIEASGSYGYMYSVDGGTTLQESPVFSSLESGTYDVYVVAQNGNCIHEEQIEILFECSLEISIDQITTGDGVGTLQIVASGGKTYEYSVDGGATFQESNTFTNLTNGTYEIQVFSNDRNCLQTESYTVDFVLGTAISRSISIAPNPTTGVFKISVPGYDYIKGFLKVEVVDLNGKVIQHHRFNRYDDVFEGTISLYAYPNGIYFLRLANAESNRLVKVIKQ